MRRKLQDPVVVHVAPEHHNPSPLSPKAQWEQFSAKDDLLHRAIKRLRQQHMNCRTWIMPKGDSDAIDKMFELTD